MRLLEYQSKKLLQNYGISFAPFHLIHSNQELNELDSNITFPAVLKAQLPFGGRKKNNAIRFVQNTEELKSEGQDLLSMTVKNTQVQEITIEEKVDIVKEFYLGITWDTQNKQPIALLSLEGGIDIESLSKDKISRHPFNPWRGLMTYEARRMAQSLGCDAKLSIKLSSLLTQLSKAFLDLDALTLEINPLALTADGKLLGVDAHLEIEEDALYRQEAKLSHFSSLPQASNGRLPTELEIKAKEIDEADHHGVAGRVVEFPGNMALLIGGGGASLTVFDAIRKYGGEPANYCEVGGNPTKEKVSKLTTLLLSKPGVKKNICHHECR